MGEGLFSRKFVAFLIALILFVAFSKASFATTICDRPDYRCTVPALSNWKYGGAYDSLDSLIAAITDNFHKYTQGNCPLNLPTAPWGPYFPNMNLVVNVGDGYSSNSVTLGEGTYFTSITTSDVSGANGVWCPSELQGYENSSSAGGFAPIGRSQQLLCPSNSSLHQLSYGGHDVYVCLGANRQKVVVLDPGHGLTCALIHQNVGAVGVTDFPTSNPPAGKLREDYLTVAIALETEKLLAQKYKVVLTKRDVNSCPSLKERGRIANNANAKAFVSIHINAPNTIVGVPNPFGNGTSALYNSAKPLAQKLADQMSQAVSVNLGTNNRGPKIDDTIAVLKPTVTNMTAVLIEIARLSGSDEQILHAAGSTTKAAAGIQSAVQSYLNN